MAKRRRRSDRSGSGSGSGSSGGESRSARRSGTKAKSGGGLGPIFVIMGVVVVGIIIAGFMLGGGENKPPTTRTVVEDVVVNSDPRQRFVTNPPKPWTGQIGDKSGTVRIGMSDAEVVRQFGEGKIDENYTHHVRTRTYFERAGDAGIFEQRGGNYLSVLIDIRDGKPAKVFGFTAPDPSP